MRKIIYGILFLVFLANMIGLLVFYQVMHFDKTVIHFLDVGQGDAILISEGSYNVLIDGGPDGRRLQEQLGRWMPFWDRTIDVVIATHPDADHIDGLVDLFGAYHIPVFWHAGRSKDTDVSEALERVAAAAQHTTIQTPHAGDEIVFPSGATLRIVYPDSMAQDTASTDDYNAMSITGIFYVGEEAFFLGGDLPTEQEDQLNLGTTTITVLKAGHHGSKTSTSETFLTRIAPRDVIISAGKNNRYGHPHKEVLKRVLRHGARVFSTITEGTITYTCRQTCVVSFE